MQEPAVGRLKVMGFCWGNRLADRRSQRRLSVPTCRVRCLPVWLPRFPWCERARLLLKRPSS